MGYDEGTGKGPSHGTRFGDAEVGYNEGTRKGSSHDTGIGYNELDDDRGKGQGTSKDTGLGNDEMGDGVHDALRPNGSNRTSRASALTTVVESSIK